MGKRKRKSMSSGEEGTEKNVDDDTIYVSQISIG